MYVGWDIWHTFGRRVWSSLQVCKLCAKGWRNNLLQFFCRISLSIQVFCNGNYGIARAQKKEIKKVTKFKVSKRVFLMLQFATAAVIFCALVKSTRAELVLQHIWLEGSNFWPFFPTSPPSITVSQSRAKSVICTQSVFCMPLEYLC